MKALERLGFVIDAPKSRSRHLAEYDSTGGRQLGRVRHCALIGWLQQA
jgi:hypothetical protein